MAGKAKREQEKAIRRQWKEGNKERNKNKYSNSSQTSTTGKRGPQNSFGARKTPSTKKLYRGGTDPITMEEHKELLKLEAAERQKVHNTLSPQQKIEKLNNILGKDMGAKRERAKLKAIIEGKIQIKDMKKSIEEDKKIKTTPWSEVKEKRRIMDAGERKRDLQARIEDYDRRKAEEAKNGKQPKDYKEFRKQKKRELVKAEVALKKASDKKSK